MTLLRLASALGRLLAVLAIVMSWAPVGYGGNTWDGGGANNNWTTGQNWNPAGGAFQLPPLNNGFADIVMAGTTRLTPIVDVPYSIRSLTFDNTAGAFTILGVEELTIGAGGITNNDAQLQSVIGPVKLSADQIWTAAAGRLQTDVITLNGFDLGLAGARQIDLLNIILGAGDVTLADSYTSTVTMVGPGNNSYSGHTDVQSGTLVLQKGGVAVPGDLTIGSGGTVRLDAAEQIAAGGSVQVESGGLLNLNGHNETFARLIVSPGGSVTTGAGRLNVTQEFQVTGGTFTGNLGLGDVTADVTLDGHVSSGADLIIGDAGAGSLGIRSSSSFSNANAYIGDDAGSTGAVTVDDVGSGWDNSGDLYVGNAGNGRLDISNDADVFSQIGYVGFAAGSSGEVTVTGTGSRWRNTTSTIVGRSGTGTLNVLNGGTVSSDGGSVGAQSGSIGTVNIDNGSWTTGILTVGAGGDGNVAHHERRQDD